MNTPSANSAPQNNEDIGRAAIFARSKELREKHSIQQVSRNLVYGLMRLKSGTRKDHEEYGFRSTLEREHGNLLDEIPDWEDVRNFPPKRDDSELRHDYSQFVDGYDDTPYKTIHSSFREFLQCEDCTPLEWKVWADETYDLAEDGEPLTDNQLAAKFPDFHKTWEKGIQDVSAMREKYATFAEYLVEVAKVDQSDLEEQIDPEEDISWFIVSDWMQGQLEEQGEIVLDIGNITLWGRTGGGQAVEADAAWLNIARKELLEEQANEKYEREQRAKHS